MLRINIHFNKEDKKHMYIIMPIAVLLLMGFILLLFGKRGMYSESERRALVQYPAVVWEDIVSGTFMQQFDEAATDQFPFRDMLRKAKAYTGRFLLAQKDNHSLYIADGYLSKMEYPLEEKKIARSVAMIKEIEQSYLSGADCRVYYSVIPDKNYFLAKQNGYPAMDYQQLVSQVQDGVENTNMQYIDIFPYLTLEDYYRTDQHWRQEQITDVAKVIADAMHQGEEVPTLKQDNYTVNTVGVPFYGAYVGQIAMHMEPDTIHYLTNEVINQCIVTSFNSGEAKQASVYNMKKAKGRDPYEMFLEGSDALIEIENPLAETDRELVIFRDSFGSSIAPLLLGNYRKITLIDLRYMRKDMIGSYISFDDRDVLFLYSTLLLNSGLMN